MMLAVVGLEAVPAAFGVLHLGGWIEKREQRKLSLGPRVKIS